MNLSTPSTQTILEHAIELALDSGWENFTLFELAQACQCTLIDIRCSFRSKDDLAEALFDQADHAMLQLANDQSFLGKTTEQRTVECIMCWFNYLIPYKPLVKDIMRYKFEPGHFHLQAHGITRVSRTVQWFREVSQRRQRGISKVADEVALTSCYLSSFLFFITDSSQHHGKTRALLSRQVRNIDKTHDFFTLDSSFSNRLGSLLKKVVR